MKKILIFILLIVMWCGNGWTTDWCSDANVIVCYNIENGSGSTVIDQSTNNDNGTTGATWDSVNTAEDSPYFLGTSTWSLDFNGTTDEIEQVGGIADPSGTITISSWIKADSDGENSSGRIIELDINTFGEVLFLFADTKDIQAEYYYTTSGSAKSISTGNVISNYGTFYHVAFTFADGVDTYPTIYINGVEPSYGTQSNNSVGIPETINGLHIGNRYNLDRAFDGNIDELVIFGDKKDSTDINSIMAGLLDQGSTASRLKYSITNTNLSGNITFK